MKTSISMCALSVVLVALAGHLSAAASSPTARPAVAAADLCKGAVDPYEQNEERELFLQAAGADNELDTTEFQTAHGREKSFVRPFDRWEAMLAFDKNGNGKIDWFEADAYRQDLRKRVLTAFDADKDGKLTGQERDSANRALAAGKIPAPDATGKPVEIVVPTGGQEGPAKVTSEDWAKRAEEWRRQWEVKRYDKDGDGRLSEQETAAMEKEKADWKAQADKAQADWVRKWDTNGDGKLDEEERKAMMESLRKQADDLQKKMELKRWDKNGDGVLDEQETAAMEKEKADWKERAEQYQKELLRKYDTNEDGKLDENERKAMTEDMVRRGRELYRSFIEKADTDGDGKVSPKEYQEYWDKLNKKYDADGDGKLNEQERRKMMKEEGWDGGWGSSGAGMGSPARTEAK